MPDRAYSEGYQEGLAEGYARGARTYEETRTTPANLLAEAWEEGFGQAEMDVETCGAPQEHPNPYDPDELTP